MNIKETVIQKYLTDFEQFEQRLNGQKSGVLHELRRKAIRRFTDLGFPSTKDEAWRHTSLEPLLRSEFSGSMLQAPVELSRAQIEPFYLQGWPGAQLVFVDGQYQEQLSLQPALPQGVILTSLNKAFSAHPKEIADLLKDDLPYSDNAFGALNTAFLWDGMYLEVAGSNQDEVYVHLIFIASGKTAATASYPRNLIHLKPGTSARVAETYLSLNEEAAFTNTLTSVLLEKNTQLKHFKVQQENENTVHIGNTFVRQRRDSRYISLAATFGGRLVRNNIRTLLQEPGAETVLDGLYMGHQRQHMDNHTVIEHVSENCNSHELYQGGILADEARAVFSGMILVHRDAQRTDAKQSNNCLLLSDAAKIDSKPQLEIYADDVKCTHGATVGQLDKEAVFYLRSRGIGLQRARNMLTYAFAEKVIERIHNQPLRERIDGLILQRFKEQMNFEK